MNQALPNWPLGESHQAGSHPESIWSIILSYDFLITSGNGQMSREGKQVPRSSLPVRPLCISLNIVFINKAKEKKKKKV